MKLTIQRLGTIDDVVNGITWDASRLSAEVERRAANLKDIGPGSIVAITHGGTAAFFADLFAVWSRGAAAACLDPALTASERENVVRFCNASIVLGEEGPDVRLGRGIGERAQALEHPDHRVGREGRVVTVPVLADVLPHHRPVGPVGQGAAHHERGVLGAHGPRL